MRVKSFKEAGIILPKSSRQTGSVKVLCPKCSHTRTKSKDPCLSITFNRPDASTGKTCHFFNCHHCPFQGAVFPDGIPEEFGFEFNPKPKEYKLPALVIENDDFELTEEVLDWFESRGIHENTVRELGIRACQLSFNNDDHYEPAAIFPFYKDGVLINIQYRNLSEEDKRYRSAGGCQFIYYGFDDVVVNGHVIADTLYIVEGPLDKATMWQVGYPFTWSVPNGSPFKEDAKKDTAAPKLEYHNDPDVQAVLKRIKKVVFVGDDDYQGRALVKELATRIGVEKCYRVVYPPGCKDINEVLTKYGPEKVIETVEKAERFPVEGIIRISQVRPEVKNLYHKGFDTGLTTGFPNLDENFRIGLGKLILVTGVPESGKSRFMANICNNVSELHGVKWSMFTPEHRPFGTYAAKMAQIRTGKPFGKPGDTDRMSEEELDTAMDWMENYFSFNAPAERSLQKILEVWRYQLETEGTRYGIIDPFNYVSRPDGKVDEHQFILKFLVELADWCAKNNCTAFVVAHPTKVEPIKSRDDSKNGEYPVITPYKISGSAHWNNCADFILSIWRSIIIKGAPVRLHILKAKQEELGTSNEFADFVYDVKTGIYTPHTGKHPIAQEQIPFYEDEFEPEQVRSSKHKHPNRR